jgi:site-specific recombinase XerD
VRNGRSVATVETYRRNLGAFVRWYGPERDVTELSRNVVNEYMDSVMERGVVNETVAHYMRDVKAFVRYLAQEDYIEEAPKVTIPTVRRKLKKQLVTTDDYERLIRAIPGRSVWDWRNRAVVALLYDSGCRVGELLGLKVSDVDVDLGTAIVNGKGDKQRVIFFGPKTAGYLAKYRSMVERVGDPESFFVLNSMQPMSYVATRSLLRRLKEESGVECATNAHNFRHSFATNFLRNGGDVMHLRRIMGHSTLQVTELYTNLVTADLKTAHDKYSPLR